MSNQSNAAAVRAFRILEILSASGAPMTLAEIVAAIGLPKQTVHRILKQLEAAWLVTREAGSRHYEPSSRVRAMAVNALMHVGPAAARHGILQQLVDKFGETCNLSMLSGDDLVYLDRIETDWSRQLKLSPGSRVPLHCTASGKLLLAFLPRARREKLIAHLPLRPRAENTITDLEDLREELTETRKRRVGTNNEEHVPGMIAVAVPVMLDRNRACAAIAVQASAQHCTLEKLMTFLPDLQAAADKMSATFNE
ncbi:Transcriptional regulator KdgR [Pandoraea morbifera]|uniref:Transcriptional regulator KdgR n=1 Tax=Pandoraea morbifera TaxID=2508300 RepID=A0A5E4V656_9BURK|nr:IclR family transcriptional regulator [Pandoraea morbifera]VVE06849.1 Transcriptional regulator KdgR [Pandoraea morbifera]